MVTYTFFFTKLNNLITIELTPSDYLKFMDRINVLKEMGFNIEEFGLNTTFIPPSDSATIEYSPSASNAKLSIPINIDERDINVFIVTDLPAPDLAKTTIL